MKSGFYLLLLSLGGYGLGHSEVLDAPAPDQADIYYQGNADIIYEIGGDLTYDQETHFEFVGGFSYDPKDVTVTFRGKTGQERLVFDNSANSQAYFELKSSYGNVALAFENLLSFSLLNLNNYYNVLQLANDYEESLLLKFQNIGQDITVDNNAGTGGAIGYVFRLISLGYSKSESLIIDSVGGDVKFTNNRAYMGIIGFSGVGDMTARFTNIEGSLIFANNTVEYGGVININAYYDLTLYFRDRDSFDIRFKDIGKIFFDNNQAGNYGGVISMIFPHGNTDGAITFEQIKEGITITNNTAVSRDGGAFYIHISEHSNPGAFPSTPATASIQFLDSRGGLLVSGNNAASFGGAVYLYNAKGDIDSLIHGISDGVTFSKNKGTSTGGAFYMYSKESAALAFSGNNGTVLLDQNSTDTGSGGFAYIYGKEQASFTAYGSNGLFQVSGNTAGSSGGALYLLSNYTDGVTSLSISGMNGDVKFLNNAASNNGGAIYLGGKEVNLLLSADGGDIIFQGNTHRGGDANSILFSMDQGTAQFRAAEGRSIYFYDPIHMGTYDTYLTEINKPDGAKTYTGQVIFSGEDFDFDDYTNLTSYIQGDTIVYDGEFLITDNAVYGALDIDPLGVDPTTYSARSFTVEAGTLEFARNGTLIAEYVTMHPGSLLRVEYGGTIIADHVDFSRGVLFDIMPFVDNYNCGLQIIQANALTLDQNLSLYDKLDLYTHPRWTTEQRYLVLSLNEDILNVTSGDFADILSYTFDTNILSSPYIYDGSWHMEWVDTTGDGIEDELYAVWTPADGQVPPIDPPDPVDPGPEPEPEPGPGPEEPGPDPGPGITEVHPELDGTNVLNSLWSTISNVQTLKNTALGQIGLRRSHIGPENNYWATGIAEFSHHNTVRGRNGYEYTGWGYAVGADHALDDNTLLGVAFGNLYGTNKSKNYNGEIKQKTYIGMIYGAWDKELDKKNTLRIQGDASYGHVDNTLKTAYSDGDRSRGTWDNNVFHLYLEGAWDIDLGEDWVLTPYVAVEFAEAKEKSFTETGDKIRSFGPAQIRNLTLPVGIGVSKLLKFENGMKWINGITLSYLPDVYRKNPEAEVVRLSNGFEWTAVGSKPSRNAGQASWQSRLILNDHWSVFASYTFEARSHAMYHGCNAGVSCSF